MKLRLFGIDFEFDFLFFIVLSVGLFVNNSYFLYLLLFSCLHELGHIITLYIVGGKAKVIRLSFYGVGMQYDDTMPISKEIVVLISGIIVNLLLAILNVQRQVNMNLLIINALPIYPLDFGRIIKLILDKVCDINASYKVYYFVSALFLLAFIVFAIYKKNFNLIIISVYIFMWLIRGNI